MKAAKVQKKEYENRTIYDGEFLCKRANTAIRRMINTFNELSWIAEVEPEKNICALDYDSFIIENEIDGLYYIACVCWK